MKIKSILLAAGLATAVLAAPASADSIRLVNINSYQVVDNQHVILRGGVSRYYLVTLANRCHGLRYGMQIGTSLPTRGRVFSPRTEYIVTRDSYRCYIDTIEEVEDREAAQALIAERAAEEAAELEASSES